MSILSDLEQINKAIELQVGAVVRGVLYQRTRHLTMEITRHHVQVIGTVKVLLGRKDRRHLMEISDRHHLVTIHRLMILNTVDMECRLGIEENGVVVMVQIDPLILLKKNDRIARIMALRLRVILHLLTKAGIRTNPGVHHLTRDTVRRHQGITLLSILIDTLHKVRRILRGILLQNTLLIKTVTGMVIIGAECQ